jgi:hypothetical protein
MSHVVSTFIIAGFWQPPAGDLHSCNFSEPYSHALVWDFRLEAEKMTRYWKRGGSAQCNFELGKCFYEGWPVREDKKEAVRLWLITMGRGSTDAEVSYGIHLLKLKDEKNKLGLRLNECARVYARFSLQRDT